MAGCALGLFISAAVCCRLLCVADSIDYTREALLMSSLGPNVLHTGGGSSSSSAGIEVSEGCLKVGGPFSHTHPIRAGKSRRVLIGKIQKKKTLLSVRTFLQSLCAAAAAMCNTHFHFLCTFQFIIYKFAGAAFFQNAHRTQQMCTTVFKSLFTVTHLANYIYQYA